MAAPTKYPDWALQSETSPAGAPNKVDIPLAFKNSGLQAGEPLYRAYLNENFNLIGLWVRHLEERLDEVVVDPSSGIINLIFPAGGGIWITETNDDPATRFSLGTWQKIEGRFLVGQKDTDINFDVPGELGGSKTHTHSDTFSINSAGAHSHTVSKDGWGNFQFNGGMPEGAGTGSVSGRLVTAAAKNEISEKLESLGQAVEDRATDSAGSHTHTLSGGIASASNLPPYHVVNIWKRTA